jgi:large subunit ribosomal protein L24
MEKAFSTQWISSTQPRKQRKYRYNAPLHIRGRFLGSHLSKDLRAKYGTRATRVRKGDDIKVMRGQYAGKSGKVERIDVQRSRVFVSGIDQVKRDGTKKPYPLQPSNLLIIKVADDKRRFLDKEESPAAKKEAKAKNETQKPQTAAPKSAAKKQGAKDAPAPRAKNPQEAVKA